MAHDDDRSWMLLPRSSVEWQAGLDKFIDTIFEGTYASETTPCPCSRCCGVVYKRKSEVQMDLLTKGFDENFVKEKGNAGIFLNDDRDLNVGPPDDASSANKVYHKHLPVYTNLKTWYKRLSQAPFLIFLSNVPYA